MRKASSNFLEHEWLNVLESIDDAVLVATPAGHLEFMNEGAAALMGISAALAVGRPIDEALEPNPWVLELLETTRATGVRTVRADSVLQRDTSNPNTVPVRAAATLLVNDSGTSIGTLLTLQDLSYQRELESRSRETDRLRQLEILVAGLAHEVGNPLSGMRGAAQILEQAVADTPRSRECTSILLQEIDRLNDLIAQLLDLAGPARLDRTILNVHELLDSVITTLSAESGRSIFFAREFDPSLPGVRADAGRLTQVMINLIRNAMDACSAGQTITLRTRMETTYSVGGTNGRDQFLSVDISDEGGGIPPDQLGSIFNPFFTTKAGGTGLGLSISQRIVTEHGGVLRVRNSGENGAVFTMTLPVDRSDTDA